MRMSCVLQVGVNEGGWGGVWGQGSRVCIIVAMGYIGG